MTKLSFKDIPESFKPIAKARNLADLNAVLKPSGRSVRVGPASISLVDTGTTIRSLTISKFPSCCGMRLVHGFSGDKRDIIILLTALKRYFKSGEVDRNEREGVGCILVLNDDQVEQFAAMTILPALGFPRVFSHVGNMGATLHTFMWHHTGKKG